MKVFISWSGNRSKYIAESLRSWLPKVIQAVKPWMSKEDISSGARWAPEIASELENSRFGIVCLTPENQMSPWIMFETGALSKTISNTFVCPYLHDIKPEQLSGPMTQFQASISDKEGTLRILTALNSVLEVSKMPQDELEDIFEVWWPRLETMLEKAPGQLVEVTKEKSESELLAEILNNSREQLRREEARLWYAKERDKRLDAFVDNFAAITKLMEKQLSVNPFLKSSHNQMLNEHSLNQKYTNIDELKNEMGCLISSVFGSEVGSVSKMMAEVLDMKEKQNVLTEMILEGGKNENIANKEMKADE